MKLSIVSTAFWTAALIATAFAQQRDGQGKNRDIPSASGGTGGISAGASPQSSSLPAGKEHQIWYFGKRAGISFAGGTATPLTNGAMNSMEAAATMCDRTTGALLFYTNGNTVWDATHRIMPGGEDLLTHESSTQAAVIVPFPQNDFNYYLFTSSTPEGDVGNLGYYGLRYSVIDLRANGGRGAVVRKDVPVLAGGSEKLTAVPHGSGSGYWVLTREWGTDLVHAFLVDCQGVSGPVSSHTGGVPYYSDSDTSYSFRATVGYLKASPDGRKLVSANAFVWDGHDFNYSTIELFDFDNRTGRISNRITLDTEYRQYYGVSFSPDNSKLYAGGWVRGGGIAQFDLSKGDSASIVGSMKRIELPPSSSLGDMQIGPDGKIYVAVWEASALGVINNPNEPAPACNYRHEGFPLAGKISQRGLCNMMASPLNPTRNDTARLRITKTVSNPSPSYGDTISYRISACFLEGGCGPVNVTITDTLPEGLLYLDGMNGYPRHDLGAMREGDCRSVTVRALVTRTLPPGVDIANCADLATGGDYPVAVDRSGNCATINVWETDLSIVKVVNRSEATAGDRISYSVLVVNNGPTNATNVRVNDLLPSEVRYLSHTLDMPGTYDPATGNLDIPLIPMHSILTFRVECTVLPGGSDIITNCARLVRTDPAELPSSACVETRRLCPAPEITARGGIPRDIVARPGAEVMVPVRLLDPLDGRGVRRIGIGVGYDSTMLTLLDSTMAGTTRGTLLEGWTVTKISSRRGHYRIELEAGNPGEYLSTTGTLLNLRFQLSPSSAPGSELPVTIDLPGSSCTAVEAATGSIRIDPSMAAPGSEYLQGGYAMKDVRPNPAGSQATFQFSIGIGAHTTLEILDGTGSRVAVLVDQALSSGTHSIQWNTGGHPSGIYYYRIRSGDWSAAGSLRVVK